MGNMGRKLMGFGMAWSERQVFVMCVPVHACVCTVPICLRGQCVFSIGKASVWKVCMCASTRTSVYLCVCIYFVAFAVDKPHSSNPLLVHLHPRWPVKHYGEHQSLRELWPLSNCKQSHSCHSSHTHKSADKCTVIEGRKRTCTQIRQTNMIAKICSEHRVSHSAVCLSAETHLWMNIRTLSLAPWLVAISPRCFLGSTHWGSWSPIMKDEKTLAIRKTKQKNRYTQRDKHAHMLAHILRSIQRLLFCWGAPLFLSLSQRELDKHQLSQFSKTGPLYSPPLSFITWGRAGAVCQISFGMYTPKQILFSQTNVCVLIRFYKACHSLIR